ncbi:vitronectin a precursor [Danio rerio]|uniref:Vitronectin a n=1 Tax=Danio rerio TaxID=7955 RepID=Q502F1_DANRE|nr:vitronectin a precursor [Danio rerio]AAH95724.1 Vitronectin a [Danio rerio]|eukprot:NP_001018508.1 vitronectin precursor [Danio rerio]
MRVFLLLLVLLSFADAAEESCIERCENGFDATKSCQCDSMCTYYKSCCTDYESLCRIKARGDTFPSHPEDDFDEETNSTEVPIRSRPQVRVLSPSPLEISSMVTPVLDTANEPTPVIATAATPTNKNPATTPGATTTAQPTPTKAKDPDAEVCSGRPFDAFMQLKNGSIYAFRGEYFFELDEKSVLPGYPKLIEDIWGIKGPIDAAFTRINCQGKTYIFKGNKYWRFDDGVLDDDFPRDIAVGFEKIPDHLDAAFATPAHSHHGKEKVYFFKGDQYYHYEFKHQPSHEECIKMSLRSPSMLFRRYTDIYYDRWTEHFNQLFGGAHSHYGHHFINRDWIGIKSPVDAVLVGRLYVTPRWQNRRRQDRNRQDWDQQQGQQYGQQWDQRYGQQWGSRRRQNRSPYWESMAERGISIGQEFSQRFGQDRWRDQDRRRDYYYDRQNDYDYDYRYKPTEDIVYNILRRSQPLQSVYFFKGDKYYRVNLQTKRVDYANPPYPRPIGKYWLGCKDTSGAEKR